MLERTIPPQRVNYLFFPQLASVLYEFIQYDKINKSLAQTNLYSFSLSKVLLLPSFVNEGVGYPSIDLSRITADLGRTIGRKDKENGHIDVTTMASTS